MKTITEFANKCFTEMNTVKLTTTECVAKYLDLWHREQNKFITDRLPSNGDSVLFKLKNDAIRIGVFLEEDEWGRKNIFCDGAYILTDNVKGWIPVADFSE